VKINSRHKNPAAIHHFITLLKRLEGEFISVWVKKMPPGKLLPQTMDRYLTGLIVKIVTNACKKKQGQQSKISSWKDK